MSASPIEKVNAINLLVDFEARKRPQAFPHFTRKTVADGLRARVLNPGLIDQAAADVCPSAVLIYSLADEYPVVYVQFVIKLYEHGVAKIKDWEVKPGKDLKNYSPPGGAVHAADWIPMASIRDSENWLFDYQEIERRLCMPLIGCKPLPGAWSGGASAGELAKWFRKAGYTKVVNKYSRKPADQANLGDANEHRRRGYKVVLVIDDTILYDDQWRAGKKDKDNHVVVLTSPTNLGKVGADPKRQKVNFTVFTWGEGQRKVPEKGELPLDTFLKYYYGFVAAKY